jgi:hypothetical protein
MTEFLTAGSGGEIAGFPSDRQNLDNLMVSAFVTIFLLVLCTAIFAVFGTPVRSGFSA